MDRGLGLLAVSPKGIGAEDSLRQTLEEASIILLEIMTLNRTAAGVFEQWLPNTSHSMVIRIIRIPRLS